MKKIIRKLFTVILLTALLLTGLRFGPDLYARVFGGGRVQWISERFSETLKEKNHLVVYEVETTGQEMICTPNTGHPVLGVFLCDTVMNTRRCASNYIDKENGSRHQKE